jgi:hypothetical protein
VTMYMFTEIRLWEGPHANTKSKDFWCEISSYIPSGSLMVMEPERGPLHYVLFML